MSPTTRRGRAVLASQRKSPARGTSDASRKPVTAVDEIDDGQVGEVDSKSKGKGSAATAAPVRRQRGFARLKKTSGYKYANEAFGAYRPVLLAFVVIFAGVWGWISFGPHAPTPQDNWRTAENAWLQKRDDARQKIIDSANDFSAQQAAYKDLRDDTKGWMDQLRAITTDGWDGPNPSLGATATSYNSDLVTAFISAGDAEGITLDSMVTSTTWSDFTAMGVSIVSDEQAFESAYAAARSQILGVQASASGEPTLAVPSLCPDTSVSASPDASSSASASPSASPSPSPSSSPSVSPSSSAGAAASPDVCASAAASASAAAAASASPSPAGTPGPSALPSTTAKP